MTGEFDEKAFREQMAQRQRDRAEASWRGKISSDKAKETHRFAKRLIRAISPSELLSREFPNPLQGGFAQVVRLSDELDLSLECTNDVGNLLEQGFNDTRDTLQSTDVRIIGRGIDLESAIASATHPQTAQSIANIAVHGQEGMRNHIKTKSGLRTIIDPTTGIRVINENVEHPIGNSEIYNRGCPFASSQALVDRRLPQTSPIFLKFVAYAGEVAARSAALYGRK